jgi:hypothetical protein
MKAVIAASALAGFLLFGPGLAHSHHASNSHTVIVDAHVATHVATHVTHDAQSRCKYQEDLDLSIAVGGGDVLRLLAGSGSLQVDGVEGLTEVRAEARACASHEEFLEDLDLTFDMNGDQLLVETHYPDFDGTRSWGNRYARLDLRLEVPMGMAADIRDSSGEMALAGMGALTVEDSSGEIEIHGITGSVKIDDSSGEIEVWDVTGDVEIDDGSGEINLENIRGGVTIDDGSGEIDARNVEGTFRVVRDGSGSIEVDGVGGDFVVERDGSGSIRHRDVSGTVDIPRRRR